ncbi:MAG: spinster family MFS transporter [Pseudomonadales bacterium]
MPEATKINSPRFVLGILFFVALFNYLDRMILAILLEPIKAEFALSDTQLGLLTGLAFAMFYASFGIPLARLADTGNRRSIIAWSLAAWSALTMACGMAQSFIQLLVARIGVAIGEAGAVPPSHSLIGDYYPPEKRAGALAVFSLGSTVGYLIGFALGGFVAEHYGWRMAFLLVGFPGLLFALVVRFCLAEPRLSEQHSVQAADDSVWLAARLLLAKRSYCFILAGFSFYAILSYGATQWVASFLIRTHGMGLAEVGFKYGMVVSLSTAAGVLAGGWLSNRLYDSDIRWSVWLPAIACLLGFPVSIAVFSLADTSVVIMLMGVLGFSFGVTTPPAMAAVHLIAGERRRALAIAFVFLMTNLVGLGIGPVVIGAASDWLAKTYGDSALGIAILSCHVLLLVAAVCFHVSGRSLQSDAEV